VKFVALAVELKIRTFHPPAAISYQRHKFYSDWDASSAGNDTLEEANSMVLAGLGYKYVPGYWIAMLFVLSVYLYIVYPIGQGLYLTKRISPCPRWLLFWEGIPPGKILDCGVGHLLAATNCSAKKPFSLVRLELSNKIYLLCLFCPSSFPRGYRSSTICPVAAPTSVAFPA
jgi:hypothetical protein